MNGDQFKALVKKKYSVDSTFWAPELAVEAFRARPESNGQDLYQIAMCVLCANERAFKDRISGTTQDEWLSAKTFNAISSYMVLALQDLSSLVDEYPNPPKHLKLSHWQNELVTLLKTFQ